MLFFTLNYASAFDGLIILPIESMDWSGLGWTEETTGIRGLPVWLNGPVPDPGSDLNQLEITCPKDLQVKLVLSTLWTA